MLDIINNKKMLFAYSPDPNLRKTKAFLGSEKPKSSGFQLKVFQNLQPFFEDCYRRINVREYSKIIKVSPPTASKILFSLNKEGLLLIERERNYIFFYSNKENKNFVDLSRIYWNNKLKELVEYLDKSLINPCIILFGSLSKAEVLYNSDIDIAIFSHKRDIKLTKFENKLKRRIQIFFFDSIHDVKNKELANSILNGHILKGRVKI